MLCKLKLARREHLPYKAGCLFWFSAIKISGPATLNVPHAFVDQHYRLCTHLHMGGQQGERHFEECGPCLWSWCWHKAS